MGNKTQIVDDELSTIMCYSAVGITGASVGGLGTASPIGVVAGALAGLLLARSRMLCGTAQNPGALNRAIQQRFNSLSSSISQNDLDGFAEDLRTQFGVSKPQAMVLANLAQYHLKQYGRPSTSASPSHAEMRNGIKLLLSMKTSVSSSAS